MWEVAISEIGWYGPILDLKLIAVFCFFKAALANNMQLLKHEKLDKTRNDFLAILILNLLKELFISHLKQHRG